MSLGYFYEGSFVLLPLLLFKIFIKSALHQEKLFNFWIHTSSNCDVYIWNHHMDLNETLYIVSISLYIWIESVVTEIWKLKEHNKNVQNRTLSLELKYAQRMLCIVWSTMDTVKAISKMKDKNLVSLKLILRHGLQLAINARFFWIIRS